jgi:hypothetical protein
MDTSIANEPELKASTSSLSCTEDDATISPSKELERTVSVSNVYMKQESAILAEFSTFVKQSVGMLRKSKYKENNFANYLLDQQQTEQQPLPPLLSPPRSATPPFSTPPKNAKR